MIYITGDTHGEIDIKKLNSQNFTQGKNLIKDDILIILGDFGLIWNVNKSSKEEEYWIDWLNNKPWTTYVVLGNHENYDRLNKCPKTTDKNGNKLRKIRDSIFWLENGIHYIQDKKFLVISGGTSLDKKLRIENISWWKEEVPTEKEFHRLLNIIDKNKNFDYILTHSAPESLKHKIFDGYYDRNVCCPVELFFDCLEIRFEKWFFGHYHIDKEISKKFRSVYEDIICL